MRKCHQLQLLVCHLQPLICRGERLVDIEYYDEVYKQKLQYLQYRHFFESAKPRFNTSTYNFTVFRRNKLYKGVDGEVQVKYLKVLGSCLAYLIVEARGWCVGSIRMEVMDTECKGLEGLTSSSDYHVGF